MKYYVYLWIDPKTGIERYVGKGGYPQRVLDHWYANTRLGYMLRKRKREGFNPQPVFIKQGLDELTASAVEKFWIKVYGREDLGTGALFNLTDGGDGCSGRIPYIRTDEIKEKVGAKNRGKVPHNKGKVSPEKGIPNPKKSHPNKNKGKKLGPNPKNSHPNRIKVSQSRNKM
jgi:hypothetical protein